MIIFLICLVVYVIGWLVAATMIARAEATDPEEGPQFCHGSAHTTYQHQQNCRANHGDNCWRADPAELQTEVTYPNVFVGLGWGLAWPILALIGGPAALVHYAANKKPPRELLEARIKQLEKEVGLGD